MICIYKKYKKCFHNFFINIEKKKYLKNYHLKFKYNKMLIILDLNWFYKYIKIGVLKNLNTRNISKNILQKTFKKYQFKFMIYYNKFKYLKFL